MVVKNIERTIKKFISEGGSSSQQEEEWKITNLRILKKTLKDIEESMKEKGIGMNRNAWILEAIMEKLERNGNEVG
jgi:hypothetical protein